uniref:Uncharacterized protein n=1 Tax=Anopheles maculatus TaxID=74869 RepID=A0A182ST38_9DIPT
MLQTSLQNATVAQDVPSDRLRTVVKALRLFKAHLPLLVYSFQRVGMNLHTAETFIVTFKLNQQSLPADFMGETVAFNAALSSIEDDVGVSLLAVEEVFNNTGTQLENDLTGDVQNQAGFMQVQTALKTFTSLRSLFVKNVKESVLLISLGNRLSVETLVNQTFYYDSAVTLDSPALDLATNLIQSNVFDRACYNKFAALVSDLPTMGRIRLAECLNTELPRLHKLQRLIKAYGLMVSYDDNDLWNNLKPCRSEFAASNCMAEVGASYPRLYAARDDDSETRAGNFFASALTASFIRIDLCFTKTNFLTFHKQVPTLRRSIGSCFNGLS